MRKQAQQAKPKPTRAELRASRLLPGGVPRWVRCYDNGDTPQETIDRYTVIFTGRHTPRGDRFHPYLAMSAAPFHPQGFCQHGETANQTADTFGLNKGYVWPPAIGRRNHLGRRIRFEDLPADCQRVVLADYRELWGLN